MYQTEKGSLLVKQGDLVNRDVFILLKGVAVELKKSGQVILNARGKEEQIIKEANLLSKNNEGEFLNEQEMRNLL